MKITDTVVHETELAEMIRQLSDHFIAKVRLETEAYSGNFRGIHIDYVKGQSGDDMQMFNLVVRLGVVDMPDLQAIAKHFDRYCVNEDKGMRLTDGRHALLGDGDDGSAVWYAEGAIRIWLRVWAVGNDYGLGRIA